MFEKIETYFKLLPPECVPLLDTVGERHRDKELSKQLPKQDLAFSYCKHVEPQHRASYEDFIAARNEIALDIGSIFIYFISTPNKISNFQFFVNNKWNYNKEIKILTGQVLETTQAADCRGCSVPIAPNTLAIAATKLGLNALWHPKCFVCIVCRNPLVDLTYCTREDEVYCERHYAETLKPRCVGCDEVIYFYYHLLYNKHTQLYILFVIDSDLKLCWKCLKQVWNF